MKKIILLFITIFFLNNFSFCQYIGVVCLGESECIQKIIMDTEGNIQIGNIYPVGNIPLRLDITDKGLISVANYSYIPPNYLTLSILKININGEVVNVRYVDLDGWST